jgi:CHAD domain-containing protein
MSVDYRPRRGTRWVPQVTARQPLREAAHQILTTRLCAVPYYLELAAGKANEDPEHVHQLRVSTRRAVEAVRTFSNLFPHSAHRHLLDSLRTIRRAADEARNLDVLCERLAVVSSQDHDSVGLAFLQELQAQREHAQLPIVQIRQSVADNGFTRSVVGLLEQIRTDDSRRGTQRFRKQAPRYLKSAVKKFCRACKRDLTDDLAFHNLRIRAKRLRYRMEILAAAFPSDFRRQLYPRLVVLQDAMGVVNDHATALDLFRRWAANCPDRERLAFFEGVLMAETHAHRDLQSAFLATWLSDQLPRLRKRFAKFF